MKNKFLNNLVIFLVLFFGSSLAEELKINASVINYNDLKKTIIAEGNVNATDIKNNKFYSDYAKYDKKKGLFESVGKTKFITSEGYQVLGNDITYDSKNRIVFSDFKTKIIDKDGNHIFLEMFNYYVDTNIFFSKDRLSCIKLC